MAASVRQPGRRTTKKVGSNTLLALMSAEDRAAIARHLEPYELKRGTTLLKPLMPVEHVYFISDGLVSLVQLLENGRYIEAGIVGREGMVGALVPLGAAAFSNEAVVQISGMSLRMSAEALRVEVALRPHLRDLLLRYIQALFAQITYSVTCNNQHTLRRRLARWLSMASDFTETENLSLTHELLSVMLGVRRSGVTEGVTALKKAGLIVPSKGGIRTCDVTGLHNATCECYAAVKSEYRRLLGPAVFSTGAEVRKVTR
jgi:CRP-like cAMP-binding protein